MISIRRHLIDRFGFFALDLLDCLQLPKDFPSPHFQILSYTLTLTLIREIPRERSQCTSLRSF
jgi:hypothetical protein